MVKIVLDSNSAVRGLLDFGAPREIVRLCYRRKLEPWASEKSFSEFCRIIRYPRLERRVRMRYLSTSAVEYEYQRLLMFCLTEGIAENFTLDEDPDDEEFVRIALASSAEFIITGDNHLLNVNEDFPTRILRPSDFMGLWRSGQIEGGTDPTRRIRRTWKIW